MVLQSDQYQAYEHFAMEYLILNFRQPMIISPIILTCRYWMPDKRSWPDLMGLLQATADILQKAHIIENDRNVIGLDGSRIIGVDGSNPRTEIEIKEVEQSEQPP